MKSILPSYTVVKHNLKENLTSFLNLFSTNRLDIFSVLFTHANLFKILLQNALYMTTVSSSQLTALNIDTNSTFTSSLKLNNLTSGLIKLLSNEETLNNQRGLRFNSPVFCYDYRAGDYFPKFYQENITYLLPTFTKITGGVRTPT